MHTFVNRVRVTASRPRDHIETISIPPGDVVGVGHRTQQYPESLWCASACGRQGWVADSYLEITSPTEAVALRGYDASQLTVVKGEVLHVPDRTDAWVLGHNASDAQGWVPATIVEDAVENAGSEPS